MLKTVRTDFGLDSNLVFLCISWVTRATCILSLSLTFLPLENVADVRIYWVLPG